MAESGVETGAFAGVKELIPINGGAFTEKAASMSDSVRFTTCIGRAGKNSHPWFNQSTLLML